MFAAARFLARLVPSRARRQAPPRRLVPRLDALEPPPVPTHRPSDTGDGQWHAASEAVWSLGAATFRPPGYTSADAAGLPILPGLVRPDEVYDQGVIRHALRFTVPATTDAYVFPASHV